MKLIVIIRDPAPLIVIQEPLAHRRVEIELTPEQQDALQLRETGENMGKPITEQYSFCFLEDQ